MTPPPSKTSVPDLISAYVLGQFSTTKAKQFQQQLKSNPKLAKEVQNYQLTLALLTYSLVHQEPPPELKETLLQRALEAQLVDEESPSNSPLGFRRGVPDFQSHDYHPDASEQPPKHSKRSNPSSAASTTSWQWVAAMLGGLAAIAGVGFVGGFQLRQQSLQTAAIEARFQRDRQEINQLRQELQSHSDIINSLSQPNTQVHALTGTGSYQASASLLATPDTAELAFVAADVPLLGGNEVYRLWALVEGSNNQVIYCGQFRHDSNGTARWVAPNIACTQNSPKLLVTVDTPEAPTTSVGLPIMESEV